MTKTIVLALAIAIALSACADAPVSELDPSNEYGDGIGRNFHRWRGKDYGTAYPRGPAGGAGQAPTGMSAH
jgi:hypothetical protein